MENYRLFIRSMKVMGRRLYIYLSAVFIMSVSISMFSIMGSMLMKSVVDISQSGEYQRLSIIIAVIIAAGTASLLIYRAAAVCYNVEAKKVYGKLSESVLEVAVNLPYSYYEKHHSGEIMSKISYDLIKMGDIYGSRLRRVVMPLLQVAAFLVPMFYLSWQLTLCLAAVNVLMMGTEMLLLEPMHMVSRKLSTVNVGITSRLSDLLQGMEQARMYDGGRQTVGEIKKLNHDYAKKSNKKIIYTACLECSGKGFELLCSLVFLVIGISFVNKGYTTLGALTAVYTMYGSFSFQFLQIGKYVPELVGCLANAKNIFDFLDETGEPQNWYADKLSVKTTPPDEAADETAIDIDNITFSYGKNADVFDNFSLRINRGECVAITGASGCGKTTLSKLLLELYPLDGGTIKVNGLDIRECSLAQIRELIAYVPQEPYLFNASVKDNIRMGKPDATDEEIIRAAVQANAHEFIEALSEGYDTNVGERGNLLSGGQRQRIAIARAVLKCAPVILMDEATSALDNESEQAVNAALKSLRGSRTILMIAHRPSTIRLADRVCCIE